MDLATIIGILGGMAMIVMSMALGGDLIIFYNLPSILIVFVGSIFVAMQKFTLEGFLSATKVAGKAYSFKLIKPEDLIIEIVTLADAARKGGLLSLEGKEVSIEFLGKGIQLLVDGHDPDVVKSIMGRDAKLTSVRHQSSADIFAAIGDVAPAMGMIGTLIGLVGMLANMDDPKTIGPAMAVALLTTLYGSVFATVVALPIKDKCLVRDGEESTINQMVIDGLLAIQGGQNPRVIEQMLKTYLPSSKRGAAE